MPYTDPEIRRAKGAERLRRLRKDNPDWNNTKNAAWKAKNREKYLAHKAVENALLAGRVIRKPCERCGSEKSVHAHHDDYSKPLVVIWLCALHHRERHRELDAIASADPAAV